MSQTVRFEETLRRLAIFDEAFVEAGFGPGLGQASALGAKTAALLQVAVPKATGSSPVCLQWSGYGPLWAGPRGARYPTFDRWPNPCCPA